jgi:hypothetical protein
MANGNCRRVSHRILSSQTRMVGTHLSIHSMGRPISSSQDIQSHRPNKDLEVRTWMASNGTSSTQRGDCNHNPMQTMRGSNGR